MNEELCPLWNHELKPPGKTKLELEILILEKMIAELETDDGFYETYDSKTKDDGVVVLGGAFTGGGAHRVFHDIWKIGWVTLSDQTERLDSEWGDRLEADPMFIQDLPENLAHELLSWFVRGNKWSDGFFGWHAAKGNVSAVLSRLLLLKQMKCDACTGPYEVDPSALREDLVRSALWWQRACGVAPHITSAISEFDASRLVGMPFLKYSTYMQDKTFVSPGADFVFNKVRYQIKANRPSGKPGSVVTRVGKANNYDWDQLIWILYDQWYEPQEAWLWHVDAYRREFDQKKLLGPKDYRSGIKLEVSKIKSR